MESTNINFQFNPRRCEDHLSVFGKKVLNVLIRKWTNDQKHAQNTHYEPRVTPSIRNRRVLHFRNEESVQPIPPIIFTNSPCVPTHLQLVQTAGPLYKTAANEDFNIPSHDLINPVVEGNINIVSDFLTRNHVNDVRSQILPVNNSDAEQNNSNNIDWDDMFDSELLSQVPNELVFKQIETHTLKSFNIKAPLELLKETGEGIKGIKQKEPLADNIKKSKRKQQPITDIIPKKVKKVLDKTSCCKQNYKKTVYEWLDGADPNSPVETHEMSTTSSEQNNANNQTEVTIEKVSEQCKKVVQARLTNKDGIMKFGKPKTNKSEKQKDAKVDESLKITDDTSSCEKKTNTPKSKTEIDSKEKKNKPKFVVPIKSQIPVKDVMFEVITIDENNIKKHVEPLKCIADRNVVMVLTYRNGFCQLNNQHTEDICDTEGVIIVINDVFFYFKECFLQKEILQSLLQKNKIICYEGKALLIYMKYKLGLDVYNIDMIDTKIGGSLLDPENPPENFSELQKLLSFTPGFTIGAECILQKTAWYASLLNECSSTLMNLLKEEQLWNVFLDIEMKLLPIIAEMESRGVTIDQQKLKSMEDILLTKMKSTELECHKAAGKVFQINSAVQVRALIYDELQLDTKCNVKIRETLTKGVKSTSESMLRSLMSKHPLPKLVLEYRHLHKAHATFLNGISQHVKHGVVKPTWVQVAAATGRIASNNPNLQAIPKTPFSLVQFPENDDNEQQVLSFRSVYVARAGYTLVAADFQHVECRVFAHAAADAGLLGALRGSRDLFRALAHKWLNKPESEVSAEDRERTKRVVYASLYGAGSRKLMDILDVSYDRALSVIASFNRTFPALKNFSRSVVSRCEQNGGRLSTLCGRVRRFKNISSLDFALKSQAERQAVNFIVQGSAADLCKMAMVATSEQLRRHAPQAQGALLLQIHDELVWEVLCGHEHAAAEIIKSAMEGCGRACGLALALPVSLCVGASWGEMRDYSTD